MAIEFDDIYGAVLQEQKLDSDSELLPWIKNVINEVIQDFCNAAKYSELRVRNAALTFTTAAQSVFALPVDAHKVERVEFNIDSSSEYGWYELRKENQYPRLSYGGYPVYFTLAGVSVSVYPNEQVAASGQAMRVTYYKKHPVLSSAGDDLLVEDLFPAIVRMVCSRVARYHNAAQKDTMMRQDAETARVNSV